MEVVPTELLACFDQTVEMKVPEESDRVEIVRLLLSSISCANVTQVDLTKIARRTSVSMHLQILITYIPYDHSRVSICLILKS